MDKELCELLKKAKDFEKLQHDEDFRKEVMKKIKEIDKEMEE